MSLPTTAPDLDMLDLLIDVAETGSLGRAAARQGISQPAASMRIAALERRLRLHLIERGPTGSRLTEAGAAVVDWARPVLDAATALTRGADALRAAARGRLRLAASMTIADHLVPGWLVGLHEVSPQVTVSLRVGNSTQVAELVEAGEVDLGFVEGPRAPAGLRSRVIGGDELVLVVGPGHPWARRHGPIPADTLAATPLITRERGSGTRDAAAEFLGELGVSAAGGEAGVRHTVAAPAAELGSTVAIKAAVGAGEAPAVLSRLAVQTELEHGRLVRVSVAGQPVWRRRFRAVWSAGRPPGEGALGLLAIARRSAAQVGEH